MPRAPYPKEFREQILSLYRSGSSVSELADDFEPCPQTIRNWIKQAEIEDGQRQDGVTTDEKEELARLRKECRKLRQEREILKKAAAWFAQETNPTNPNGSSNS
jgi:transposase-like protein